tara:strand:+ start:1640 stop:2116 length:477 start_codon:yes stop_codon:yes gene_type:complete
MSCSHSSSLSSTSGSSSFLSLYIPIISESTSEAYIKKMFVSNNIGKVLRIDFVKNKSKNRREAFIHFDEWFDTEESKSLREDILNPETKTRFKYSNNNKFWPLLVNKNAHNRVENPNYKVLSKEDVESKYKKGLNITIQKILNHDNVQCKNNPKKSKM